MQGDPDDSFKTVCTRRGVSLERSTGMDHMFRITMLVGCSLEQASRESATSFYDLLLALNTDVIRAVNCMQLSDGSHRVGLELESVAPEFGIPRKTLALTVHRTDADGAVTYHGSSPPDDEDGRTCSMGRSTEVMVCRSSCLTLTRTAADVTAVEYVFDIDFSEELPIFMENVPGLLMKKVFVRLKNYLDNTA